MKVLEKLLDYVSYPTMSNEDSNTCPSSDKQLILGKHLVDELKKLGCNESFIDENGYVYGYLKGDPTYFSLGLIAHMDTSPDANDANIFPSIIENYDGTDIKLKNGLVIDLNRYPNIADYKGKTIVVTDGNTLLGADDKAGIAIINELLNILKDDKNIKHGDIRICFTPDEEIGRGAKLFNYDYFKVDYCYTLDGDRYNGISFENFNAASAEVTFSGISVHPGSAKDKMVNALNVAHEFHDMLDHNMRPEHTDGLDGFNHLVYMEGDVSNAKLDYILRNFDENILKEQKDSFIKNADILNKKYGYKVCEAKVIDNYANMKKVFNNNKKPIELFYNACKTLNIEPVDEPIRGGTDGATISLNGLPCPNLGTGGDNFHGPYEIWCKDDGEKVVEILLKMLELLKK